MSISMSKKGVSGLIVAVLLVAVALTIGGLVMGWISGYTDTNLAASSESQKKQDECFDRDFKVISVNATGPTGNTNGSASIVIENKNDQTIKGFLFKFVTEGDQLYAYENKTAASSLSAYVRNTYRIDDNSTNTAGVAAFSGAAYGAYNISEVDIIPIIDIVVDTTQEVVCTSKLKTIDSSSFVSN